jgi:uncharacterized protein (TIGR02996 family)
MSDAAAFLRAIIAEPADDLPRLVYADWLDEHGEPERAEFIRVQCAIPNTDPAELIYHVRKGQMVDDGRGGQAVALEDVTEPKLDHLRRRADVLQRGYSGHWRNYRKDGKAQRLYPTFANFRRGFVSEIILPWRDWREDAAALLATFPIRRVNRPRECMACSEGGPAHGRLVVCPSCRGRGTVDDWRGDGVVRLTSLPAIDLVRQTSNGYVQRIRGGRCEVKTGYGEPYESVFLKATAAEYPGVDFGLPATADEVRPNDFVGDTLRQQGFSDEQIASWDRLREFTDYAAGIAAASPAMTAPRTILSSTTGDSP